ncbi:MAG: hypothetical protein OXB84_01895, partial [Halobacteriovoraceae bacterium]|nr:hypothetical protein [Halobacteriovoraceae bacterium]
MIITYLLILFSLNCFSEDYIQAHLFHEGKRHISIYPGEIFQAVIKISPADKKDLYQFNKIENTLIADLIYISELRKISYSDQSIIINATVVLNKYIQQNTIKIWELDKRKIQLRLNNVNVLDNKSSHSNEDYIVYEQKGDLNIANYIPTLIIVIVLLLISLIFYRKIHSKNEERKKGIKKE